MKRKRKRPIEIQPIKISVEIQPVKMTPFIENWEGIKIEKKKKLGLMLMISAVGVFGVFFISTIYMVYKVFFPMSVTRVTLIIALIMIGGLIGAGLYFFISENGGG